MIHTATLSQLEARKEALVAQCAVQRATFAECWRGFERPAVKGKRALDKLRSPWLWAGLGLLALKLPMRKFSRIPIMLFKGWQLARKVHAIMR
jgi:hypothetical protein